MRKSATLCQPFWPPMKNKGFYRDWSECCFHLFDAWDFSSSIVNPFTKMHVAFSKPDVYMNLHHTCLFLFTKHRGTFHHIGESCLLFFLLRCLTLSLAQKLFLIVSTLSVSVCVCVVWVSARAKWLISNNATCFAWQLDCAGLRPRGSTMHRWDETGRKWRKKSIFVGLWPHGFPFCLRWSNKRPSVWAPIRGLKGEGGEKGRVEIVRLYSRAFCLSDFVSLPSVLHTTPLFLWQPFL